MRRWKASTGSSGWSQSGRRNISWTAKSGWKGSGTAMRRWHLILSCGIAAALAAVAQQADIRVDVNLVRVITTVKDAAGQPVGSLSKEDFTVLDNNVPQEVAVFERHTEQPLSVALLIDTSGSTAKDLKYEVDSVSRFLRALFAEGNPEDGVALF